MAMEEEQVTDMEVAVPKEPGTEAQDVYTPRIIGFLCNWCSYAAADLCGVSRYQYPNNLRIVRVMCSARIEMSLILELLLQGADGVFVGGCHLGDCHYLRGNYYTEQRIRIVKKLLKKAGLDPDRVRLEWISASEGERFAKVLTNFTVKMRQLGASPLAREGPDITLLESLYIVKNMAEDFRLRAIVSNYIHLTQERNVYGKNIPKERYEALIDQTIDDEYVRHWILFLTRYTPKTVEQISERTGIPTTKIVKHIVTLMDRGLLTMESHDPPSPTYLSHAIVEALSNAELEAISSTSSEGETPGGGRK